MIKFFKSIADAVSGVASKLANEEQRDVNKLQYRVEAAMKYVHCIEKTGEFKKMSDAKREAHLLHYRKRIFDV